MNDVQKSVLVKLMLDGSLVSHHHNDDGSEAVYIYKGGKFQWITVLPNGSKSK
jgi:hypothetical protein